MRRALELVFRRKLQLLLLLLVLPVLGLVVGLRAPRSYQSFGSIWVALPYDSTDLTWVANWYSSLGFTPSAQMTPAQAEGSALTALLGAHSFALAVAQQTGLAAELPAKVRTVPGERDDALYRAISQNVKVTPSGNNLIFISYSDQDRHVAQQVVAATMKVFAQTRRQQAIDAIQAIESEYNGQLPGLQSNVDSANSNLQNYVNAHPYFIYSSVNAQGDPNFVHLSDLAQTAQKNLDDMQAKISELNLQASIIGKQSNVFFATQDPASLPAQPESRLATLALAVGTGLGIAVLICACYLALLMRSDRTAYSAQDLRQCPDMPVLLCIPRYKVKPHKGQPYAVQPRLMVQRSRDALARRVLR